ncbi:hypothetical protein D3C87_1470510 [compost metagenome]
MERHAGKGKYAFLGPTDVLDPVVCADAKHALGPDIIHPFLAEAHVRAQTAQECITLPALEQPIHRGTIDQRKIACVLGDGDLTHGGKNPVESAITSFEKNRHFSLDAAAINYVGPGAPTLDKCFDEFWRILQVTIHQHHGFLAGDFHAASKCRL